MRTHEPVPAGGSSTDAARLLAYTREHPMADEFRIRVNIGKFREEIRQLGALIERRIATNAVRAAARVFRDAARADAPVLRKADPRRERGALKRSVTIFRSRNRTRGIVSYTVGVRAGKALAKRGGDPFYWRFLERGWIPRGPGKRLKGGRRRRSLERRRLRGTGAQVAKFPFLAPAFQRVKRTALAAFERAFEVQLNDLRNKR